MTTVTGVGYSESEYLGVSTLIGPRWDEKKEKQFSKVKRTILWLLIIQVVQFSLICYLMAK